MTAATRARAPRPHHRMAAVSLVLMSLAAVVLGAGAFLELAKLSRMGNWPTVAGTISRSDAVPGCKGLSGFTPRVEYTYTYAGIRYWSNRPDFHVTVCEAQAGAAALALRYPAGTAVTVHVNPDHPSEAVLDTRVDTGALWAMGIVALLLGGGGLAWVVPRLRAVFA